MFVTVGFTVCVCNRVRNKSWNNASRDRSFAYGFWQNINIARFQDGEIRTKNCSSGNCNIIVASSHR